MSATQNKPLVIVKRAWDDNAPKQELVDYLTIPAEQEGERARERKIVNFVPVDDGTRGIEHFMMYTLVQFINHATEADLTSEEKFNKFGKVLAGSTLRYWNHIVLVDVDPGYDEAHRDEESFVEAVSHLRNKLCGEPNMGETQMWYLSHKINSFPAMGHWRNGSEKLILRSTTLSNILFYEAYIFST